MRKSVRKIREIPRLHFDQKLGQRQIARSVQISQSTVHEYVTRAHAAGLTWPLDQDWDEQRLEQTLFPPGPPTPKAPKRAQPDFLRMREQLEQHRDLMLELLWEADRQQHPDGYCYSRLCKLYRRWRKQQDVVLRQDHRPGKKLFLGWAGATIPIHYADGSMRPKTGVTRACIYEPDKTCLQFHRRGRALGDDPRGFSQRRMFIAQQLDRVTKTHDPALHDPIDIRAAGLASPETVPRVLLR